MLNAVRLLRSPSSRVVASTGSSRALSVGRVFIPRGFRYLSTSTQLDHSQGGQDGKSNEKDKTKANNNEGTINILGSAAIVVGTFAALNYLLNDPPAVKSFSEVDSKTQEITSFYKKYSSQLQTYMYKTYSYVLGGIAISSISAFLAFRSGLTARLILNTSPIAVVVGGTAICLGSMWITMSTPPDEVFIKHAAWATMMSSLGAVSLSAVFFAPAPLVAQAAFYTLATAVPLTAVALTAKSDSFLFLGGPLMVGLTVLLGARLSVVFFPASQIAQMASARTVFWPVGLFALFLLNDTNKLKSKAERYITALEKQKVRDDGLSGEVLLTDERRDLKNGGKKTPGVQQMVQLKEFDYLNESLVIYLDLANLFLEILRAMLHVSGNNNRR